MNRRDFFKQLALIAALPFLPKIKETLPFINQYDYDNCFKFTAPKISHDLYFLEKTNRILHDLDESKREWQKEIELLWYGNSNSEVGFDGLSDYLKTGQYDE